MTKWIHKNKVWCIVAGALIVMLCVVLFCVRGAQQPVKKSIPVGSSTIDFTDKDNYYHTADNGIGIVRATITEERLSDIQASKDKLESMSYPSPELVWNQEESTTSYNNFTLPEAAQMGDSSIGILTIPDIRLSVKVYESEDQMEDMNKGVAHFKSTSAWDGTIGLSAHNVNFDGSTGHFYNLHHLKPGDALVYETALGNRAYVVESCKTIEQSDWTDLERTAQNRITMITCISGQPNKRLCVTAVEKIG